MNSNVFSPVTFAISETRRIMRLTRKPKRSEYEESIKVCGAGIIIIGAIGFIIFLLFQLLQRSL
jgi:protein transport protein SEC61 subunit gamma and related proteins